MTNHGLSQQQVADLVDHVKTVCAIYHLRIERDGVYRALEWMDPLYKSMLEGVIVRNNSTISQFIGPTFRNIFGIDLLQPQQAIVRDTPAGSVWEGVEKPVESSSLSFVARSNLYMMTIAGERDKRQQLPEGVEIPSTACLLLRARLIMEEAVETCNALGFKVNVKQEDCGDPEITIETDGRDIDVEEVVDGCCDTIYVCVGTLLAFGVPDMPHLQHVCECNNAKMPNGVAITDEGGKVIKPEGWKPPNHERLMEARENINLRELGRRVVERVKNGGKV